MHSLFICLPLEIKLRLLSHVTSLDDLYSIVYSCSKLYRIKYAPGWSAIRRNILDFETDSSIPRKALQTLQHLRETEEMDLSIIAPPAQSKPFPTRLLLSNRSTIRFFTLKFFDELKHLGTANIVPRISELHRVDEAFYTLWLFSQIKEDHDIAVLGTFGLGLLSEEGSLAFEPDLTILFVVYQTVLRWLSISISSFWERLDIVGQIFIAECVGDLRAYERKVVPNILLHRLGLDGLRDFLRAPLNIRLQEVSNICYDSWSLRQAPSSRAYIIHIIEDIWTYHGKTCEANLRPLWVSRGGIYNTNDAPWSQHEDFRIEACVWDDERLQAWGFSPPLTIL